MKKIKVYSIICFALIIGLLIFDGVYANSFEIANDFWQQANDWYQSGVNEYNTTNNSTIDNLVGSNASIKKIIDDLGNLINILGTTVIVCVTTFLGIKYIFTSSEGKAEVKDGLITLVVACFFFFGWNAIWNLMFDSSSSGLILNKGGYETVIANVFSVISLLANICAVGGVIFIGIRYIFAGANGKAELKAKSWVFLLGIILAFCSVGILNYISEIINQVLAP